MQKNIRRFLPLILILAVVGAAYYYLNWVAREDDGRLTASGTVEAVEVIVASEIGGRVTEVLAAEGDLVSAGQALFQLDSEILQAQRARALAALGTAQANRALALTGQDSAQAAIDAALIQLEMAINAARAAEAPTRTTAWQQASPEDFQTPVWYFTQEEARAAAQAELESASETLTAEQANFSRVIAEASNADLIAAETRLAEAQASYLVAFDVLQRANAQADEKVLDFAQSQFDAAQAELEAAQRSYDQLLSEQASTEVLEARARLTVAQERYETAIDRVNALRSGEESLTVQAARALLTQAQTGLTQATASVTQTAQAIAQAEAEIALLDLQIGKLTVYAPLDGRVLSRNIEPGEIAQPGGSALTLVDLNSLTLTVYVPEDRYGEINLGALVEVSVDSFPDEVFQAEVVRIADRAEYTPRNVQTTEGRRSTVFAVELAVQDPNAKLKPGMPADVLFNP